MTTPGPYEIHSAPRGKGCKDAGGHRKPQGDGTTGRLLHGSIHVVARGFMAPPAGGRLHGCIPWHCGRAGRVGGGRAQHEPLLRRATFSGVMFWPIGSPGNRNDVAGVSSVAVQVSGQSVGRDQKWLVCARPGGMADNSRPGGRVTGAATAEIAPKSHSETNNPYNGDHLAHYLVPHSSNQPCRLFES